MALKVAMWTTEPAPLRLGNAPTAGRTGGGRAALVHQPNDKSHAGRLVPQRSKQVSTPPLPQSQVLCSARVSVGNPLGVTDHQNTYPLLECESDDLRCGLVVGLVDTATMTRLNSTQLRPVPSPAARATLARFGRTMSRLRLACLLVLQVEIALGADRAPRHQ